MANRNGILQIYWKMYEFTIPTVRFGLVLETGRQVSMSQGNPPACRWRNYRKGAGATVTSLNVQLQSLLYTQYFPATLLHAYYQLV